MQAAGDPDQKRDEPEAHVSCGDGAGNTALIERLREALRKVIDPEVGLNIVDLGLVYALKEEGGTVRADITMTSPACPMGESILAEAEEALQANVPTGVGVEVNLVWSPPWSPELMSEAAREHFGW
jgi:metal-sulfur cluster biosynthetic enzyme